MNLLLDYQKKWDYISKMTLMATAELKSLVITVATESVSKFCKRPRIGAGVTVYFRTPAPLIERKKDGNRNSNKETATCAELVDEQWRERQEDLKNPEYEALAFDYVEPHTWDDQPEGTGVGSSAGAGRATSSEAT